MTERLARELPTISVLIPLFNQLPATRQMLASLLASLPTDLDYEVILIDDGSTDGTRDWLAGLADQRLRVLLNPGNLGYAAANNRGAATARGTLLVLLNNDLLLSPRWLEPMLDALQQPRAALVGNLQYRMDTGALDHAGIELDLRGQFQHRTTLPPIQDGVEQSVDILAVTGACCAIRRADFDAVGGFDEAYRNGGEDIDLCFKLRQRGQSIRLAVTSRVDHHVSLSRGADDIQALRNSRLLFLRWRDQIKDALSKRWFALMQAGGEADRQLLPGELSAHLLATPRLAARLIAESMLAHEEAEWQWRIDGIAPNADLERQCHIRHTPDHTACRIDLPPLRGCHSLTLVGSRRAGRGCDDPAMALRIRVNDVQEYQRDLGDDAVFRLTLERPLTNAATANRLQVAASRRDRNGTEPQSAGAAFAIDQVLIDACRRSETA